MQLIGVQLTNYRKYGLAEIAFPDGLIGIIGPNGAGKSTLMEAVAWALYGNPAARTQKEEIKRQGADEQDPCRVLLQLRLAGDEYQIARELKGKELLADATISVNRNEVARGAQACSTYVARTLGLDREAFFTSFFAKQKELNALSELSPAARKDLIIRMLGIDSVDRASDLARQSLREIKTRVSTLRESISDKAALSDALEEKEKILTHRKEGYEKLRAAKTGKEKLLENAGKAFKEQEEKREKHLSLVQECNLRKSELKLCADTCGERKKEIEKLKEAQKQLREIEPAIRQYEHLKKKLEQLSDTQSKFHLLAELMAQRELLLRKKSEHQKKVERLKARLEVLDKALHETAAIEGELDRLEREDEGVRNECSAVQSRLWAWQSEEKKILSELQQIASLGPQKKCPRCHRPLGKDFFEIEQHFEAERAAARSSCQKCENQLAKLRKRHQAVQAQTNLLRKKQKELKEKEHERKFLKQELDQTNHYLRDNSQELSGIISRIEGLGETEYDPQVHQELKDRLKEISQARDLGLRIKASLQRLPQLQKQLGTLAEKRAALERQVRQLEEEEKSLAFSSVIYEKSRQRFEEEREQYHGMELSLKDSYHQCQLLELEIASLKKELENSLRLENEVSELTIEQQYLDRLIAVFQGFRKHLIGRVRPALSHKASDLFNELTNGRYSKMELSEDYDIFIFERGERFSLERFSGGEKDLANLCMRLAISDLIIENSESELGFIVLDEVFGSQDPERKANIMRALARLSPKFRQIFLITHIDDVKDGMEHVITVQEGENHVSYARLE